MVVPLACRLVANRLAGQRYGADAALVCQLFQGPIHRRDAERRRFAARLLEHFLRQQRPARPRYGGQDGGPLRRVSFHRADCRVLSKWSIRLV